MSVTTEEFDMTGQIDRSVLNLLYNQGYIIPLDVLTIVKESSLDLTEREAIQYSKVLVTELEERFLDNVEAPLFRLKDNILYLHEEAKEVFDQILVEEYNEDGEVVAKVLPIFEMEEYE